MLRKEREGGSLSRQPGARSILSLIPTFATYIAKREKMHALKDYVQAAVLRTSETVARGSWLDKTNRQRTENSERSQIFRVRQALSRTRTIDAWLSNFQPSPLIFLGMGELHHVPEKKN